MELSSRRAEYISLTGLILCVLFFVAIWVVGAMSETLGLVFLSWQVLASAMIWFVLLIQFHQRSLAEREKLDIAQLARAQETGTIFQGELDRTAVLAVAAKRLALIEKWFIPVFAVVIGAYQVGMGVYVCTIADNAAAEAEKVTRPLQAMVFMVGIGFVSYLISGYAAGMSQETVWRPLRAGAGSLLGVAVVTGLAALALAAAHFKYYAGLQILAWVVPVLMIVLGVEVLLNALLDIYRPRVAGQYGRAAFDSRLLGLFGEPGGLFHTVASAIDYQFGFQVSQTWFYRLLEQAVLPLMLFLGATLYLLSCFVVIGPGEEAIVEHFGRPVMRSEGKYTLGPGIHVKWPWPIDRTFKYPTERLQQANIGFVEEEEEDAYNKPMLWGEKHYKEEFNLLVASKEEGYTSGKGGVPVSLVVAVVPIQYRVKDLYSFLYNYHERGGETVARQVLEALCYRELVLFAASTKIETDGDGDPKATQLSFLGAGREAAAEHLKKSIQAAADRAGLGVEIVMVNLQGVHPPSEVAKEYQAVVASVQKKQAAVLGAEAERNRTLTLLAGSLPQANRLYELSQQYHQASGSDENADVSRQLRQAMSESQGDVFKTLREAEADSFERIRLAEATGMRFHNQVLAYLASPELYKRQQRLSVLEEALEKVRKYVIVPGPGDTQVYIMDLTEKITGGMLDMQLLEQEQQ